MFENSQTRFFNDSFSITDEVLINSDTELDGVKQMIKPYKKIIQKPKIILPQVSSYLETFNNLRGQKSPIKCKKIMLVGMPHSLQKTYHFEDTSVLDSI